MQRRILIPEWTGSVFEKWSYTFCVKNGWRIAYIVGDMDDCMSECMMCYMECRLRYGATVNSEKQFMFLFMRMTQHWFNTLSKKDSKQRAERDKVIADLPKSACAEDDLRVSNVLLDASSELRSVLNMFINAPAEMIDTIRADVPHATSKQFFKSIMKFCGVSEDKHESLTKELRELLQ